MTRSRKFSHSQAKETARQTDVRKAVALQDVIVGRLAAEKGKQKRGTKAVAAEITLSTEGIEMIICPPYFTHRAFIQWRAC